MLPVAILPLAGKRVLVPRSAEQAGALAKLLAAAGATPVEVPAIRIVAPEDLAPVRAALAALPATDLVVFTSANAVRWLLAHAADAGQGATCLDHARVCAVGPATAAALTEAGVRPDLVPTIYRGEEAARAILAWTPARGLRVLVPGAEAARPELPALLREAGAVVDVVAVYRTLPPDAAGLAALKDATATCDAIALTSGSTVDNLVSALGPEEARTALAGRVVASIGPVTTAAARAAGIDVTVTADEATMAGLVHALCQHFGGTTP